MDGRVGSRIPFLLHNPPSSQNKKAARRANLCRIYVKSMSNLFQIPVSECILTTKWSPKQPILTRSRETPSPERDASNGDGPRAWLIARTSEINEHIILNRQGSLQTKARTRGTNQQGKRAQNLAQNLIPTYPPC